jgi:Ca2+-binding RTX toxin-like protein
MPKVRNTVDVHNEVAFATSKAEAFRGTGTFDTVSYENAPSRMTLGDYDLGVTVDLASPRRNAGWAAGDTYFGIEKIVGSEHTDYLYGDSQRNVLDGGGSPDFLYGRGGDDELLGSGGFDYLYGEAGNDLLDGQWQTDTLYGGDGNDQLWGGSNFLDRVYPGTNYADVLYGEAGDDALHGDARVLDRSVVTTEYLPYLDLKAARDELHGGSGNDTLNGDGADDLLWGDDGADIFQFNAPYTVRVYGSNGAEEDYWITPGNDVIKDFDPEVEGDRLDLNGQNYTVSDPGVGIVIALGPKEAPHGTVTLEGVHVFDAGWVIP